MHSWMHSLARRWLEHARTLAKGEFQRSGRHRKPFKRSTFPRRLFGTTAFGGRHEDRNECTSGSEGIVLFSIPSFDICRQIDQTCSKQERTAGICSGLLFSAVHEPSRGKFAI